MSSQKKTREQKLLSDIRVFSGSAHRKLAREICEDLGVELQETKTRRFSNDNLYVHLGCSVREKQVFIIQPLSPPVSDNLIELLMMIDIARSAAAKSIHAVIPYYSYGRSDKKDAPRISITARLVADLLVAAGATGVITMSLHSPQVHGFFSVPTDDLTAKSIQAAYFEDRDLRDTTVVSPDIGHAKRSAEFAETLGDLPFAAGLKTRLDDNTVRIQIIGRIEGHKAIVVDDEIATGSSIVETVSRLREKGVTEVTVVCTHGVFTGNAIKRLAAVPEIKEIVTTNTLPVKRKKAKSSQLTILSVAPLFSKAIRRNALGRSLGDLFISWKESVDLDKDDM